MRTSCVYVNAPVALPATSGRGTDVPTILYWSNDFGTALPVIARSKRLSPISCAYDTVFVESPLTETIPSLTVSCATGAPSCFDAIVSSARRASAAAWRIAPVGAYSVLFDWLPAVNPWSTHCHVSPSTTVTDGSATSSSSATSCVVVVMTPVPSSTFPVKTVTLPSPCTASHESICFGSTSAGPIGKSPGAPNAAFGLRSRGVPIATNMAPVPVRNARRLKRRGWVASSVIVLASSRHRLRRGPDGRDDPEMRPAAAEPRRHRLLDLFLGRVRVPLQERRRGHDHPVRAVAALCRLVVDERLLDRMRLLDRAEAFERGHGLVRRGQCRRDARPDRLVAEVDGAGSALGEPAAEARPVQVELVPEDVEERRVRRRPNHVALAVHADDQA